MDNIKKYLDKVANKGGEVPVRVVSPKTYKVLEGMVRDGLISGLPYSEGKAWDEFCKRMKEV